MIVETDEALLGKKHGKLPHGNDNQIMRIWVMGTTRDDPGKKKMRFEAV